VVEYRRQARIETHNGTSADLDTLASSLLDHRTLSVVEYRRQARIETTPMFHVKHPLVHSSTYRAATPSLHPSPVHAEWKPPVRQARPMPFMYILECSDRSLYVGSTWDLDRRLAQHNDGEGAEYTRNRLPVRLLYFEEYDRVEDAFLREKQVQRWGRAKRLALVKGELGKLRPLSKKTKWSERD
jgi:putative endonuclease